MEQTQLNDSAVIDNVIAHCLAHKSVWEDIGPIAESVSILLSTQKEIKLSALVQADGTSSSTVAKNLAFELSADKSYKMSRRICAWARKNGREDVLKAVDFSESDLRYGAEDDRILRQELLVKYAREFRTELAAYKVSDAAVDDLDAAINTAVALRSGRNEKKNHRIFSTANIDQQISKGKRQMETLDDEVEGLVENEEFIKTYFIARRKTDRTATRSSAKPDGQA